MATIKGDDTDNDLNGTTDDDTISGFGGNDSLIGDLGNDILDGGDGNDTLKGGDGDDTLNAGFGDFNSVDGGAGNNLLVVDFSSLPDDGNGMFFVAYGPNAGTGSIRKILGGGGSLQVDFGGIGRLSVMGTGDNDTLSGQNGNDTISGANGGDSITGGLGNDSLNGGAGSDTFVDCNGGDTIDGGTGTDSLQNADFSGATAAISIDNVTAPTINLPDGTMVTNVERFKNVTAGIGDDFLVFRDYESNLVIAGAGSDTVNAGLGNGDSVDGGTGSDVLVVDYSSLPADGFGMSFFHYAPDSATGQIRKLVNGVAIHKVDFSGIERLSVIGTRDNDTISGQNGNDTLSGAKGSDSITGGLGNDSLDGGAGNDSMTGGMGDDTFVVNSALDVAVEISNEGTDLVRASLNHVLGANFENLVLTGSARTGTGNDLANKLTGNAANNKLTGAALSDTLNGGAGIDTLIGGTGNDNYVVDSVTDVITESDGGGNDIVLSSVSYVLGRELEQLELSGVGAINGTGNRLDNSIKGNNSGNALDGTGALLGDGERDTLTGGKGADVFVLGSAAGRYYDDGDMLTGGTADYAYVTDLSRSQGDKLRLKGTAADYLLGTSPLGGLAGMGVFFDTNHNLLLDTGDELVAVVKNNALSLTLDANYVA